MATEKFPQQNVNMPMDEAAVQGARDRMAPKMIPMPNAAPGIAGTPGGPVDGGSRREFRPGEWIDDRKIEVGGPASPSADSPPEVAAKIGTRAVPGSYDPTKVYAVTLAKPVMAFGRMLSPAKAYQMVGDVCTDLTQAIASAEELGDIPFEPSPTPSSAKAKKAKG